MPRRVWSGKPKPPNSVQPIDFVALVGALLERAHILVPQWLPGGVERNGRWYIGDFDGADGESANVNLHTGQWIDNGAPDEDKGQDLLSLYKRIFGHSTMTQAALAVMRDLGWQTESYAPPTRTSRPPGAAGAAQAAEAGAAAQGQPDQALPAAADEVPRHRANVASTQAGKADRWLSVLPVPLHAPVPKRFIHGFKDKTRDEWVEHEAKRTWEWVFEANGLATRPASSVSAARASWSRTCCP
jgi:putative DNA primase/helicase